MTKNERLEYCRAWIKKLDNQYSSLETSRAEAMRFCNNDPSIVELIKGRSEIVTTDMQDAIDMAKPDILETIAGIDEPMKLEPSSKEDVEPVKKLQILGNVMLRRKNPWFRRCSDFLDDSMKLKFGAFKYQWVEKKQDITKEYEDLTDIELAVKQQNPNVTVIRDETDEDGKRKTTLSYSSTDEYVKIDTVPAERIRFPLDTRDFASAACVIEEIRLYRHEFVAQYGKKKADKIDELGQNVKSKISDPIFDQRFKDLGGFSFMYDTDEGKYRIFECYFTEEDEQKPWVFTFIGDEVLTDEENKYGKPPYRGGSPFLMAHRMIGAGYIDYLKEIQKKRTFLDRQIFDNVTQANYRRYFGDPERLNLDDYLNNNATNALIRTSGDPRTVIHAEEKAPLPPELLDFREILLVEKDYHIPTPRSYQGVNPDVLNKTYRGQAQQVSQASKKLLMMIRGYMEDVFGPLFEDVIDCILRFMKKSTAVRYLNEDYEVTPDNVIAKYDLIVNVGLGTNDKIDAIAKLQQLIGLDLQIMATGSGVVTPQNLHYTLQELVKAMGFLNTTDFVTDPKLKEAVMQFVQAVMEFAMMPELGDAGQFLGQQLQPMTQQILALLGVQPEKPEAGGENTEGTFPGQNTPEMPMLPMNPNEPRMTPDGGGYFA